MKGIIKDFLAWVAALAAVVLLKAVMKLLELETDKRL